MNKSKLVQLMQNVHSNACCFLNLSSAENACGINKLITKECLMEYRRIILEIVPVKFACTLKTARSAGVTVPFSSQQVSLEFLSKAPDVRQGEVILRLTSVTS